MSQQPAPTKPTTKPAAASKPASKPASKTASKPASKTASKPKSPTMEERIASLRERRSEAIAGGGEKRHARQHAAGKLTARERIAELVDPLSFEEFGMLANHRTCLLYTSPSPRDGLL